MGIARVHTVGPSGSCFASFQAKRAHTAPNSPVTSPLVSPQGDREKDGYDSWTSPPLPVPPLLRKRRVARVFLSRDNIEAQLAAGFARLHDHWEKLQVSHCGMYSIERMMAFDDYCKSVSKKRVAAVCFLTPLPAVFFIILLELAPLRDPDAGCLANYVFWLRHWFVISVILETGILKAKQWVPELPLSHPRMLAISFGCSAIYVASNILLAYYWAFPIPFLAALGGLVMFPIWVAGIITAIGYKTLASIPNIRDRLQRYMELLSQQSSLMIIYPANNALFQVVPLRYRSAYLGMMPIINLLMKNAVASKGQHLEDRLPETVVFCVDVFNALYSLFCMRTSNTFSSVSIIVAFDIAVCVFAIAGMHQRTLFTQELIIETTPSKYPRRRRMASIISPGPTAVVPAEEAPGMKTRFLSASLKLLVIAQISCRVVAKALDLLKQPGQLDPAGMREIRLFSGVKHSLSESNAKVLETLENRSTYDNIQAQHRRVSFQQARALFASKSQVRRRREQDISEGSIKLRRSSIARKISAVARADKSGTISVSGSSTPGSPRQSQVSVHPLLLARHPALKEAVDLARKKNTAAVHEVLQMLFSSEYLVLATYVQCIIPPMFILCMSALHNLPNVKYYPRAREVTDDAELISRMNMITFYWALELIILLGVHMVLARKFAFAAIYQIAFVLESQALLVQSNLVFTLVFAVQSAASHYGKSIMSICV